MAFIEVAPAPRSRSGGSGPRLGIQPGYASDLPGVLVERVLPGETGATAGLKDGDRIVELASKPVKDLEDYMSIMAAQKKGGTLAITVLRGKQKLTLQAKLD
jgi:S1-C subfamily serine protease